MGCGSSDRRVHIAPLANSTTTILTAPTTTFPTTSVPATTVSTTIPLTENATLSEKNKEGISLIWVGSIPDSYTEQTLKAKLNEATGSVQFCSLQKCLAQIKSISSETVFIILNSSFDTTTNDVIKQLNALCQVESICVIDDNEERAKRNCELVNDAAKVSYRSSFDQAMLDSVCVQIRNAIKMAVDFNMFDQEKQSTTRDLTRNAAAFLWFQVLLNVLKHLTQDKHAEREMIDMWQAYYEKRNDQLELGHIAEYRDHYRKAEAIRWYTRESFLYKLLNKALRTEDVHSLCTFRTFIVDLCNQIDDLHRRRIESGEHETVTLYRGQLITKREHDQMVTNKNKLISTNGFVSTTLDRGKALSFALNSPQQSDLVPILFEITALSNLKSTTFADISELSAFPEEKEILFNLGAAFKINDVQEYPGSSSYTVVYMVTTDEGYESVNKYIELSKSDLEDDDKKIMFGRLLIDMGRYQESKNYFGGFIDSMKKTGRDDTLDCAPYYHNQGRAHACTSEFDQALKLMMRALEIRQKHLKFDNPVLAHTLNSIGVIEGEMGRYANAGGKFLEALEIFTRQNSSESGDNANLQIAVTKSNIGWVNYLKGNYAESEKCQKEALEIRRRLLPEMHPLIADNLNALGALHHAQGQYQKATDSYDGALIMREETLPYHHPAIANSYQSLGSVELENGKYEQALKYYKKAFVIFQEALGADHLLIASSYKAIGSVYLEKGDYEKALKNFVLALSISTKSLSKEHPAAGECYHHIGMVHERQGSYDKAIEQYMKALVCIQTSLPIEHPTIAKIFSSLANTYIRNNELNQAENFLTRAYSIQKAIYIVHHPDLVLTLNNMGVLYTHKGDRDKAEKFFSDALHMCKECFPENHPAVARTKFNLGELYARIGSYDDARRNYLDALKIRENALPSDDLSLADIHSQVASIYFIQKSYVEALQHWTKSKSIYWNNGYSAEHSDLRRVNENLELLTKAMHAHDHEIPNDS